MNIKKNNRNTFLSYMLLILFILGVLLLVKGANVKVNKLSYDEFLKDLNSNKVTELEITPKQSSAIYQITGKLEGYEERETFTISMPYSDSLVSDVVSVAKEKNLKVNVKKNHRPRCEGDDVVFILDCRGATTPRNDERGQE